MPLSFAQIESLSGTPVIDGERVTTLLPDDYQTARSVTILNGPNAGNLTVNPDNSLSLVMTDSNHSGALSFTVQIVDATGRTSRETIDLRVAQPSQEAGWGTSEAHYMLETDARGDLVIETGDIHRDVYISASSRALSIADIAAREGMSRAEITGDWLADNAQYGANPNMALAQDAGIELWHELHDRDETNSHWLHLERGHTYNELETRALTPRGTEGENELHPVVITAYGSGAQPVIPNQQLLSGEHFSNIVIHDLAITAPLTFLGADTGSSNVILDTLTATQLGSVNVQGVDSVSIRNATFHDIHQDSPRNGTSWVPGPDRITSTYIADTDGILIENSVFAEVGWEDGYDPGGDGNRPQAPSQFSHNVYINSGSTDVTFRDNVSAQAASYGGQLRSGGFIEDNLFLDNNAGMITRGGDFYGFGPIGNYSLISGNVVTSGAHKVANGVGATARGFVNGAHDTVMLDNIVAHLMDPDQPSELEYKTGGNPPLIHEIEPFFDNTAVYSWHAAYAVDRGLVGDTDQNIEGLNTARLDDATAANLAKQLLNNPNATLDQLVDWLADNDVSADQMLDFFKQPFGMALPNRSGATDVRFVPSELTDGVRWDNRENWSTGDVAGTSAGDRVDLGGNWVVHGGTHTIRSLDFGAGGELTATNGRLNVTEQTTADAGGATLSLDAAGQVWIGGHTGTAALTVEQEGGRFANTGVITGNVNLSIDEGQALLSAEGGDFVLGQGETLTVRGADARAGFDGASNREGIIRFDSGSNVVIASDASGLGSIGEFRSGAYSEAPRVDSNIHLGGTLTVDLRGASQPNGSYVLMSADEISGNIGSFNIQGLGSRSATLTVNYTTDEVTLDIAAGSGVRTQTVGDSSATPPPVDETPVDDVPPPVDETPVDDVPPVDETPVEDVPPPVDVPPVDDVPPPVEDTPEPPTGGGSTGDWTVAELDAATSNSFVFQNRFDLTGPYQRAYDGRVGGTGGDDNLIGTARNDEFLAASGDDVIHTRDGNDHVRAGYGNDQIFGEGGSDIIDGAQDDDVIDGGAGHDVIAGGRGNDQIAGGDDADMLTGGYGNDRFVFASDGSDWDDIVTDFQIGQDMLVLGNAQTGYSDLDDVSVGDYRGDAVISKNGSYILLQGVSVSELRNNADNIFEGDGSAPVDDVPPPVDETPVDDVPPPVDETPVDDVPPVDETPVEDVPPPVDVPPVDDVPPPVEDTPEPPTGGGSAGDWTVAELDAATSDSFVFQNRYDLTGPYQRDYDGRVGGTGGDDNLIGTARNDEFLAASGDDVIHTRDGNDHVRAGYGNDQIFGEGGSDIIDGAQDDDVIDGGAGHDVIAGGRGNDQIAGGDDADMLTGGYGNDRFVFASDGSDWDDIVTDFQIGQDMLVLGNAQTGYSDLDDVSVGDYRGDAVISNNGSYILLQGVSVSELRNNADNIFGDGGDLLLA